MIQRMSFYIIQPVQQYKTGVNFARKKISDIRKAWETKYGASYQAEVDSIPYLDQELEKKFDDINLNNLQEEQKMTAIDETGLTETLKQTKSLLAEKPRLAFQDEKDDVTVICEAIEFKAEKVFFKIRIKNNSSSHFLTGVMNLIINKKGERPLVNYPFFISSRPIILPAKEFVILYGTKDIQVEKGDSLTFELIDRYKRIRFAIKILVKIISLRKKRSSK
jgi:hypothetical protein